MRHIVMLTAAGAGPGTAPRVRHLAAMIGAGAGMRIVEAEEL